MVKNVQEGEVAEKFSREKSSRDQISRASSSGELHFIQNREHDILMSRNSPKLHPTS